MRATFTTTAFGKWILAGEHAVLRGMPAVVFPLSSRSLELCYFESDDALSLSLEGDHGKDLNLLVWGVLQKACEIKKINSGILTGKLLLRSSLPVGAGMGASGALCVALTRWLGFLGYVQEPDYYEFARNLENIFHGESSGVDIAIALSGQALTFTRGGERRSFVPLWKPRWYISYSGVRGITVDCVNRVKQLIAQSPELGAKVDLEMQIAVEMAMGALVGHSGDEALAQLAAAIRGARQCFEQWQLTGGALSLHMRALEDAGALAVKPTGSGGGGYVLSLWREAPPAELLAELIACE